MSVKRVFRDFRKIYDVIFAWQMSDSFSKKENLAWNHLWTAPGSKNLWSLSNELQNSSYHNHELFIDRVVLSFLFCSIRSYREYLPAQTCPKKYLHNYTRITLISSINRFYKTSIAICVWKPSIKLNACNITCYTKCKPIGRLNFNCKYFSSPIPKTVPINNKNDFLCFHLKVLVRFRCCFIETSRFSFSYFPFLMSWDLSPSRVFDVIRSIWTIYYVRSFHMWNDKSIENHFYIFNRRRRKIKQNFWVVWMREKEYFFYEK